MFEISNEQEPIFEFINNLIQQPKGNNKTLEEKSRLTISLEEATTMLKEIKKIFPLNEQQRNLFEKLNEYDQLIRFFLTHGYYGKNSKFSSFNTFITQEIQGKFLIYV